MTLRRDSSGVMSKWLSNISLIWKPTVSTGFKAVIGSWKISPISLPRTARSIGSRTPISSRPSRVALPLTLAFCGNRPRIDMADTDLPDPDSPTTASTSPGLMSNSTPSDAITHEPSTEKSTPSPRTFRMGSPDRTVSKTGSNTLPTVICSSPRGDPAAGRSCLRPGLPGIERIAQAVADEVTDSEMSTMNTPGHQNRYGRTSIAWRYCWSNNPSEMSGLFTPKFRKLKAVSSRMAPEMARVADTVITPTVFGRMCRKMIRRLEAPTERAASTNSFSRSERNSPRTMRASEVQVTRPRSPASPTIPEPNRSVRRSRPRWPAAGW